MRSSLNMRREGHFLLLPGQAELRVEKLTLAEPAEVAEFKLTTDSHRHTQKIKA